MPIVDGHNDLLLKLLDLNGPVEQFESGTDATDIDLPRAKAAGFTGGFFASSVPSTDTPAVVETDDGYEYPLPDPVDRERAKRETYESLALLRHLVTEISEFNLVTSTDNLEPLVAPGEVGAIAHLEGAAGVDADLGNLDLLYAAGVRSIGPVWSRPNHFAEGVKMRYPGSPDTGAGLTPTGEDLVRACSERGIVVDCSHLTRRGFEDVAAVSDAPLVVSHTAVHELCEHSRNLIDEQIDTVAESNGVVCIAFVSDFLRPNASSDADAPLSAVLDHIQYVADRVGVEHVAFGSDFDGADIPPEIGDVTGLDAVVEGLRDRGFGAREIELITHGNWLRVIEATW